MSLITVTPNSLSSPLASANTHQSLQVLIKVVALLSTEIVLYNPNHIFLVVPFFSFDASAVYPYIGLSIHSLNTQLNAHVPDAVLVEETLKGRKRILASWCTLASGETDTQTER